MVGGKGMGTTAAGDRGEVATGDQRAEIVGPIGFAHIESAPQNGDFVRLRFRPTIFMSAEEECVGQWVPHTEMKSGGAWFDREGNYITPGPLFWSLCERGKLNA